jgi:DNA helicase HerA-like ATPase
MSERIEVARAGALELGITLKMANRHGLIAGATGTGKTVTLRVIAEQLSARGVPVFLVDAKGDLSGLARPGGEDAKVRARAAQLGVEPRYAAVPVEPWDVFGEAGHPIRVTTSEMGPLLLSRMLSLNEIQAGVLQLVFKLADDNGLLLLDLKDLRAMLAHVADHAGEIKQRYGNVSAASVGAIQRGLVALEQEGGDRFFGEPAFDLEDLIRTVDGRGVVNLFQAQRLMRAPRLYSTFLLWMLSELFERLPEVGDVERPKLVFFFDEAHLLFDDAAPALIDKLEQVVRLIRSKGVGVYFITQSPCVIPDEVLGQLGNRVQHALRAFSPRDQKIVRSAAETFRPNPALHVARVITELGVGEALVSFLDEQGTPSEVQRGLVLPPGSRLAPLAPEELAAVIEQSPLVGRYEHAIDRESAYEQLAARNQAPPVATTPRARTAKPPPLPIDKTMGAFVQSAARALGGSVGRELARGVLGSLFGGAGRRRR